MATAAASSLASSFYSLLKQKTEYLQQTAESARSGIYKALEVNNQSQLRPDSYQPIMVQRRHSSTISAASTASTAGYTRLESVADPFRSEDWCAPSACLFIVIVYIIHYRIL